LMDLMIAEAIFGMGRNVLVRHPDAILTMEELNSLFPTEQEALRAVRMAMGGEWLLMKHYVKVVLLNYEEVTNQYRAKLPEDARKKLEDEDAASTSIFNPAQWDLSLSAWLGLYNQNHHLLLGASQNLAIQEAIKEGAPLGSSFISLPEEVWIEGGIMQWFHNPVGRSLTGLVEPLAKYVGKVAQGLDANSATRVIMAARHYKKDNKKWPTKEKDLVPAYLTRWPVSALNMKPLRWDKKNDCICVLHIDGKSHSSTKGFTYYFDPSKNVCSN